MEVHHHHHEPHSHKKWHHYLWEFLMLFLAVFCGFLAENYREYQLEHLREKQFAGELYDELLADSITIANKINLRLDKEKDMDYLRNYFKDSSLTVLPKEFYPAYTTVMYLVNTYAFEPKDGILSQLKSSGSLRYFKSTALQKLFGDIDVSINNLRYRNDQEYQFFANPIKLFDLKYYDFNWINEVRKRDEAENLTAIDLINQYRKGSTIIPATILNVSSFDRSEAMNIISFYKQMVVSTRTLQMNNYVIVNQKLLQMLRQNYNLK
ncbi:MAG: hypothetical protein JST17_05805 [Bacteroidetes bacterium]|nr:hypothetical protein [Bacteroidota bacterium]MBS1929928.1 hypothetical protein [Bacteroidota bacterium]